MSVFAVCTARRARGNVTSAAGTIRALIEAHGLTPHRRFGSESSRTWGRSVHVRNDLEPTTALNPLLTQGSMVT